MVGSRTPLILSSHPVGNFDTLVGEEASSWWRISFGLPGLITGVWTPIWILLAVINLFSTLMLYTQPEQHVKWSMVILACSLLSIPAGGGFIIGLILSCVGAAAGLQWPQPFQETFVGKLIRASKMDGGVYKAVENEEQPLFIAAITVFLVSILTGLGYTLYRYNVDKIVDSQLAAEAFQILLGGAIYWDSSMVLGQTVNFIGITLLKWLGLSALIYLVGVKVTGGEAEPYMVARVVALAYAPLCLQVFTPVIFGSEPFAKFTWPLLVFSVTHLWMVAILILGVKQTLDISSRQSLGVVILAGTFYWMMNHLILIPNLNLPGVRIIIEPQSLLLTLTSGSAVLATLLGVFTRK